jgi:hypothetical protein
MANKRDADEGESFREDREWHTTDELPDIADVKTVAQQYAYQRLLRKNLECFDKPFAIMDLPFPADDAPWWQFPDHPSPEYQRRQIERQLRRLQRSEYR